MNAACSHSSHATLLVNHQANNPARTVTGLFLLKDIFRKDILVQKKKFKIHKLHLFFSNIYKLHHIVFNTAFKYRNKIKTGNSSKRSNILQMTMYNI